MKIMLFIRKIAKDYLIIVHCAPASNMIVENGIIVVYSMMMIDIRRIKSNKKGRRSSSFFFKKKNEQKLALKERFSNWGNRWGWRWWRREQKLPNIYASHSLNRLIQYEIYKLWIASMCWIDNRHLIIGRQLLHSHNHNNFVYSLCQLKCLSKFYQPILFRFDKLKSMSWRFH